jgi:CSLREA domain-containing protein
MLAMTRCFRWGLWLLAGDAALAATVTVNTATDDFGSVGANCSLREAIQSANTNADFGGCAGTGLYGDAITDVIILPTLGPGGAFTLTRVGTDDSNANGDLDVNGRLRIDGVSAANSIIRGDTGDADSDRHRLLHVIAGSLVLNDVTLRDGLEDNQAAGGGLRTEPGTTTTLNRVVVADNIADGNAGGILNRGTMTLNASTVSGNQTGNGGSGGGGIYNSPNASLTLNDSRVLDNEVIAGSPGLATGGGIFSDTGATLILDNSVVDGNLADGRGLVFDSPARGGGIHASGTVQLIQSSVTNNEAIGSFARGGGIVFSELESGRITHSVIASNSAREAAAHIDGVAEGGGIYEDALSADPVIEDSVISLNRADSNDDATGGGLRGVFRIVRTTVANNQVTGTPTGVGGGIATSAPVVILNSTFIGNQVEGDGGGIHIGGGGLLAQVRSATIVANSSTGLGGGIRVENGNLRIGNVAIAGNSAGGGGADCSGTVDSIGGNLVQTASGCNLLTSNSDQRDVEAGLAPVANNGGATAGSSFGTISGMQTRAPLPGSALIDGGSPSGCQDTAANEPLATDQVGRPRAVDGPDVGTLASCDIGAVEYLEAIFADGFEIVL